MKKAFTLIELMIVIAVMVTLMGLVFRLGAMGSDSHKRTVTVIRMQKLENCLSGYNAAFGSYPPVKEHGSRDIYAKVNTHGIQTSDSNENIWSWNNIGEKNEQNAWDQVKTACKAQPVDCRFPFPERYKKLVELVSKEMARRATSGDERFKAYFENERIRTRLTARFDDGVSSNIGRHSANKDKKDWRSIQLFKFGLMSFLLPRYLVMMNGDDVFFREYAQWTGNNVLPCNPFTGRTFQYDGGWAAVREYATSDRQNDLARIANIPSQAVCARWMPNLAGICKANHAFSLFGIDIRDPDEYSELHVENVDIEIFSPGDADSDSTANQYILDGITIRDGWGSDLYYYSPAPYQRYTLWSSGANRRTFPPWISREDLSSRAKECVGKWTHDDIVSLSN